MNAKKACSWSSEGCAPNVTQLTPQRKILADSYPGRAARLHRRRHQRSRPPTARAACTSRWAASTTPIPKGIVTKYGNTTPNGIVLSADEKTLYATNGPAMAAFDVQPTGSLTNQREFAKLEGPGGGDGSTIDKAAAST